MLWAERSASFSGSSSPTTSVFTKWYVRGHLTVLRSLSSPLRMLRISPSRFVMNFGWQLPGVP